MDENVLPVGGDPIQPETCTDIKLHNVPYKHGSGCSLTMPRNVNRFDHIGVDEKRRTFKHSNRKIDKQKPVP